MTSGFGRLASNIDWNGASPALASWLHRTGLPLSRENARFEGAFFGGLFGGLFGAEEEEEDNTPRRNVAPQQGTNGSGSSGSSGSAGGGGSSAGGSSSGSALSTLSSYVPQPGSWSLVPGTAFKHFRLTDSQTNALGVRGARGSEAVLDSSNGAAYDPDGHFWYFWGGGPTQYGGNEVYRIDLEGLLIERLTTPSALSDIAVDPSGNNCAIPASDPPAGSTYDGLIWSPDTQTVIAYPTGSFCPNGALTDTYVWEFDPISMTWNPISQLGEVGGRVLAEYDPDNQRIVVIEGDQSGTIRELDPVTGQHSTPGTLGTALSEGNLVFDAGSGDLLTLTAEGVHSLAAGSLSNIQFLAALPNGVDPHAGAFFESTRGLLVAWSGDANVHTFDPGTGQWTLYSPSSGPSARGDGVFSKWAYIPELDAFAGYNNVDEGLWLFRLPLGASGTGGSGSSPVADAGGNQTVAAGNSVSLSGAGSHDPDGDPISYQWELLVKPSGSTASLTGATSSNAGFNADKVGSYSLRLTVSDGFSAAQDTLTVTSVNTAPVASAGNNQTVTVGQSTQLNGGSSYDANGDPLAFFWTITSKPSGSTSTLSSSSSSSPALIPDVAGNFVIELIVDDGFTQSSTDQVTILAQASAPPPPSVPPSPPSTGNLTALGSYLPNGGKWAQVPNTAFSSWTDSNGKLIRVTDAEANALGVKLNSGSNCVMEAWNGSAYNPNAHRMYLFGGGHNCYDGNEVYELDLENITLRRLVQPAPMTNTTPNGYPYPARGPRSHHTYDGIVWSPVTNSMFTFGSGAQNYNRENRIGEFDLATNAWSVVSGWGETKTYLMAEYDPASQRIALLHGRGNSTLRIYDPATRQWVGAPRAVPGWIDNGVANMWQGEMVYSHSNGLDSINLSNASTSRLTTLPAGLGYQAGWTIRGTDFVFWGGGKDIWIFDTTTSQWSKQTASTGPTDLFGDNRVFERFHYIPELDAFVGYANPNEGLWLYCLPQGCNPGTQTSGGGSGGSSGGGSSGGGSSGGTGGSGGSSGAGSADFATRCADPNVVQCFGFDTQASINPHIYSGHTTPTVDTSTFASGGGAMRMDILQGSGANTSGGFRLNFTPGTTHGGNDPAYPIQFGSGEEFYVQWRQRFSSAFVNTLYSGANGWKQIIIGAGDNPGDPASSCTAHEVVVQNTNHRGGPQMYHSCGVKDGRYESLDTSLGSFDFDLQPPNQCRYSTGMTDPSCFRYLADEWLTFQVRVKVGTWYNNNGNYRRDSEIELWIARQGQPSQLILQRLDYDLTRGSSTDLYGKVWLLPYNTNKDPSASHPDGFTWYDELIISQSRIADPQ